MGGRVTGGGGSPASREGEKARDGAAKAHASSPRGREPAGAGKPGFVSDFTGIVYDESGCPIL
ncbi:hypothetical protein [Sphingosinicella sp. BN140058]|uniref:hypothetical protein n=1 Tax=Sphingosinicella sp. BN140058 TaxID=1892855 RepID=UPI0010124AAD|nr:hypothetical protein [Sphingosinicella sp. BN140058]QAY78053.1 hypothetical protein ETR14_17130 [Sphingosinicella sp. BN140058]